MDLVTGGTGLIGSHLLLELASRKRSVRAIKREQSDLELVKKLFQHYRPEDGMALFAGIEWVDADLLDLEELERALEGVERIFHSAGMVSYDPRDREQLEELNVEGTRTLLELALKKGVRAFGHVSSTAALGRAAKGEPLDERAKWKPGSRNSDYAISKFMAEREVWRAREEGLPAVIVSPCIVLGPGHPGRSSTSLIEGVAKGNPFYPPGSNAFIDARDVAESLVNLLEDMEQEGERFVLIGGHRSFRELMQRIAKELGRKPPRLPAGRLLLELTWRSEALLRMLSGRKPKMTRPTARNAYRDLRYSSEKAVRSFGFEPRSVEEAISNACAFYKELEKEKAL